MEHRAQLQRPAKGSQDVELRLQHKEKVTNGVASPIGRPSPSECGDEDRITLKSRVLIADDHLFVLHGLRRVLEKHPLIEICGEARNGREAVEKTAQLSPDIVILDISMPELNGLEATRAIRLKHPAVEVLILTMHFSEQVSRQVLKAGARGYILKTDAETQLLSAIACLQRHKPYLTPRVADLVLAGFIESDLSAGIRRAVATELPFGPLSHREREVLQLLAEGFSNKEVAQRLNVSPRTVETHRNHVMHKLRLGTYSDLVKYAVRNNIVEP
jgi:DNA-binding NarL/FixJ family response regulator